MAYRLGDDGGLDQGRVFYPSWGDGMAVDTGGNVYVAGPGGGVIVLSPDGELLGSLLTTRATANCAFGDDGSYLYVTASEYLLRIRLSATGMGFGHD
jgi:gluconolactonase